MDTRTDDELRRLNRGCTEIIRCKTYLYNSTTQILSKNQLLTAAALKANYEGYCSTGRSNPPHISFYLSRFFTCFWYISLRSQQQVGQLYLGEHEEHCSIVGLGARTVPQFLVMPNFSTFSGVSRQRHFLAKKQYSEVKSRLSRIFGAKSS